MSDAPAPVRFHEGLERVPEGEAEAISGIIASMTHASEITTERYGHCVRASHAKISGVVVGQIEILPGLPLELAQGLFANPGSHPVVVRFAQGPGELLSDQVSTHRGMAIKVFGVKGEKLPGHEGNLTQDFVFATGPVFPDPDAAGFLGSMKQIEAGMRVPQGFKVAASRGARAADLLVKTFMGKSLAKLDFFGHAPLHPLAEPYYSQAALRYGDHVGKIAAFPVAPGQVALAEQELDPGEDENVFRHAVIAYFGEQDAVFDIRVQLCLDVDRMPIEDASKEWSVDLSPYRTVARLVLPKQDGLSEARRTYADDSLAFSPAHGLAAHRPLGSLMRARLAVYPALSRIRRKTNGIAGSEPRSVDEIPA